ncbi:hypothetical protein Gotur_010283, partial [Gossypium turneri]
MHFDMHDLISDVALSIASKGNPVFVLRRKHDLSDWLDDETMNECGKISCLGISELPDLLKCPKLTFLGNLRALFLCNCVLEDIALIGELKNLEILGIASSDIEMLQEELGQLTK